MVNQIKKLKKGHSNKYNSKYSNYLLDHIFFTVTEWIQEIALKVGANIVPPVIQLYWAY